jgi:hypothetical protein
MSKPKPRKLTEVKRVYYNNEKREAIAKREAKYAGPKAN